MKRNTLGDGMGREKVGTKGPGKEQKKNAE